MKTGIWEGLGRGVTGVSENWGYLILGPGYYIRAPYFRKPPCGGAWICAAWNGLWSAPAGAFSRIVGPQKST